MVPSTLDVDSPQDRTLEKWYSFLRHYGPWVNGSGRWDLMAQLAAASSLIVTFAEVASSSNPPAVSESEKFIVAVPTPSAVKFAVYSVTGRLPTPGQFPPKSVQAIDTNNPIL